MDNDRPTKPHGTQETGDARAAPPPAPRPSRKTHWGLWLSGILIVLPALVITVWTIGTLSYTYSKGERAGFIQKFSQKGWVCKTWEGELAMVNMPGAAQERFAFTVRDDSVAQAVTKLMGGRVAISYQQHKGVPGSCFGETEYFVTHVQAVPNP